MSSHALIPLFITFEGIDGAGKSTQVKKLYEYFLSTGRKNVLVTREPGGTNIGEKIREIILDKKSTAMCDITEALLYAASRAQHVSEVIEPFLFLGGSVICDRFLDSSIAYQSAARGIPVATIEKINSFAVRGLSPDVTFLLDMDPLVSVSRKLKGHEADRLESENLSFFNEVRKGYLELADRHSERFVVLEANDSENNIHNQIVHFCNDNLNI